MFARQRSLSTRWRQVSRSFTAPISSSCTTSGRPDNGSYYCSAASKLCRRGWGETAQPAHKASLGFARRYEWDVDKKEKKQKKQKKKKLNSVIITPRIGRKIAISWKIVRFEKFTDDPPCHRSGLFSVRKVKSG